MIIKDRLKYKEIKKTINTYKKHWRRNPQICDPTPSLNFLTTKQMRSSHIDVIPRCLSTGTSIYKY